VASEHKKPSNLLLRFAVGIPVGILAVWFFAFGDLSLLYFLIIGGWIGLREFWRLVGVEHKGARVPLSLFGEIAFVVFLYSVWRHPGMPLDVLIIAGILPILFVAQLVARARTGAPFGHEVGSVMLGVLYVGGLLSYLLRLRQLEGQLVADGLISFESGMFTAPGMIHLTIFPVVGSWCCDTAALFSGKYFGLKKLAPSISPGKTVVGLVGGMVGSAAGVAAYAWTLGILGYVDLWKFIAFGAAVGAFSQLGDLTVSALKREAGLKDSGRIMGAHGGMLDRIDGFLFSLPATYLFFLLVLR
jgi:phosphatidate cytidylyltransferase